MEAIMTLWPVLTGGLIQPLVDWIKKYLPNDFPIRTVLISAILNFLFAWGLFEIFVPGFVLAVNFQDLAVVAFAGQFVSQGLHAARNTPRVRGAGKSPDIMGGQN